MTHAHRYRRAGAALDEFHGTAVLLLSDEDDAAHPRIVWPVAGHGQLSLAPHAHWAPPAMWHPPTRGAPASAVAETHSTVVPPPDVWYVTQTDYTVGPVQAGAAAAADHPVWATYRVVASTTAPDTYYLVSEHDLRPDTMAEFVEERELTLREAYEYVLAHHAREPTSDLPTAYEETVEALQRLLLVPPTES